MYTHNIHSALEATRNALYKSTATTTTTTTEYTKVQSVYIICQAKIDKIFLVISSSV